MSSNPRYEALKVAAGPGVFVSAGVAKLVGSYTAAALLSQIMYWHNNRLVYEKNGYKWLVKAYHEWEDEIGLTTREARTAVEHLRKRGFIQTEKWRSPFNEMAPTMHIRLIPEAIEAALVEAEAVRQMDLSDASDGCDGTDRSDVTELTDQFDDSDRSYKQRLPTETTTETTNKTPPALASETQGGCDDSSQPVLFDEPKPPQKQKRNQTSSLAREVLNEWWERQNPRPAQPYIACAKVVESFLKAGHDREEITWMLDHAPVVSTGAMTLAWNTRPKAKQGRERDRLANVSRKFLEERGVTGEELQRQLEESSF
jgi:hypothetical protein